MLCLPEMCITGSVVTCPSWAPQLLSGGSHTTSGSLVAVLHSRGVCLVRAVDVRNVQTCENFYEFIWAKLTTITGKQNLKDWENAPRLALFSAVKGGGTRGYLKFTGDKFGRRRKQSRETSGTG